MILEADIDGDGQVKQFQFYFSHLNHSVWSIHLIQNIYLG